LFIFIGEATNSRFNIITVILFPIFLSCSCAMGYWFYSKHHYYDNLENYIKTNTLMLNNYILKLKHDNGKIHDTLSSLLKNNVSLR